MKRFWSAVLCIAVAVLVLTHLQADEPEAAKQEHTTSFWMKKKLEYSERILAGLASEDYELIEKSAKSMSKLSELEKWLHLSSPNYRTQLKIFQYANDEMVAAAEDKDLDGATLAYMQLTLSCVNCHKLVRDVPVRDASK